MSLQEIKERLQERCIAEVAEATGLHYNTVYAVAKYDNCNPTFRTIQALTEYLFK